MMDGKDVSEEGGGDVVQGGALSKGVSADQVVRFLRDHAHPAMKKQSNEEMHKDWPVPKTVAEQLRLWEKELPRNRLKCSPARMLKADRFKDEQAWEQCYKHAEVMTGGGGGVSERTETTIENGKRVTKRIKTNADGSTEAVTLLWGGDQRKKWLVVSEDGFDELDGWMRGRTSSTV